MRVLLMPMEYAFVRARKKILLETANRFGCAQNCPFDLVRIKSYQGAVAFLDFDDPVLNSHQRIVR